MDNRAIVATTEIIGCLSRIALGENVTGPGDQIITRRDIVWEHASKKFRIDELTVETVDGGPTIQWASYERGDAVAALIVNTDTNHAILVKQFRPPVAAAEGANAKLVETVAGALRQNEQPLQTLQREIMEETGYEVPFDPKTNGLAHTQLIGEFYSSPGGTSEKIHLYYVEVNQTTPKASGGGNKEEGERIETVLMPVDELFESLDRRAYKDPKLIIAAYWLAKRWPNRRIGASRDRQEFKLRDGGDGGQPRSRTIGYVIGDVGNVMDIDVWVNSCNIEFDLDPMILGTLSGRIRTLGARHVGGVITEDTIQRALERRLAIGRGMRIGNVLDTEPGALSSRGVRRLLHVASVETRILPDGTPVTPTELADLEKCLLETLKACDRLNDQWLSFDRRWRGPYRSMLLPLFGAGATRRKQELIAENVCESLVPLTIQYLREHPNSLIEKVYFLAYTPSEVEIIDSVLSRRQELERAI
jgi:ADP-ribose pyrophosphatase